MDGSDIRFLCEVFHFRQSIYGSLQHTLGMVPKQQKKLKMALDRMDRAISRYCDEKDIEIQNMEGLEYEEGLPVDPLNIEDFTADEKLYVGVMAEPVVKEKGKSTVLHSGKAFLVAK